MPAELFVYANELAIKNGFSPIAAQQPEKDPNLVWPGDRLMLPDGRLLQVKPGQYIYDIAAREYRRDMARIAHLQKQIEALEQAYADSAEPELAQAIQKRLDDIRRLAVTPESRRRYAELVERLKESGL